MIKAPRTVHFMVLVLIVSAWACQSGGQSSKAEVEQGTTAVDTAYQTTGSIERLNEKLDQIISKDAPIEIIAEGFEWSEGPLWIPDMDMLLFSDIPPNKIYQWSEEGGLQLYLTPAGYTGEVARAGEPGANGLLLDQEKRLVLCQHGDRRIARMEAPLVEPAPEFSTLAGTYQGNRLNSPNDIVMKSNGDLYFTDPPYGLEKGVDDPAKEIPFQGVYRLDGEGALHLLTKELSRPNGIAFSADERILYVANSDPANPVVMAYEVQENGDIANGRIFFDASVLAETARGLPDGLKVNSEGTIFATGPGGVMILNKEGQHLGTIKTGQPTANCALNEDESILYITANMYLMRVRLR